MEEKRSDRRLRLWEAAALIALSLALCAGVWAQARQEAISAPLLRLHVVAASDSAYEQALKLRVRDAVLDCLSPLLEGAEDVQEARARIDGNLDAVAAAAEAAAEGRQVRVSLGRELFPTRQYEGFRLPAGEYESLRVVLGQGEGHNWWCIVFPPLCVSAAQAEEQLRETMGSGELRIIRDGEGYELRFRLVELWGELQNLLH